MTFLLSIFGVGSALPITIFSFQDATKVNFYEVNDPVMGGASYGTFGVHRDPHGEEEAFGTMNGTVALIPALGAPGFIKVISCLADVPSGHFSGGTCHKKATFPDVSNCSSFALRVRSKTPEYSGFKFSFGPVKGGLFSTGYKQDLNATREWSTVALPFNQFSRATSAATGEPTKTCASDPSVSGFESNRRQS